MQRELATVWETQGDHEVHDGVLDDLCKVHRQAVSGVDLTGFFVGRIHVWPLLIEPL
jgi:hypothetical protein